MSAEKLHIKEDVIVYNCTTCNHPVCPMKNKADYYCGNYMMSKPYTLKLVLGGTEGEQSVKDGVCTGNDNSVLDNYSTGSNDLTANR